jgi:hypothetical protein
MSSSLFPQAEEPIPCLPVSQAASSPATKAPKPGSSPQCRIDLGRSKQELILENMLRHQQRIVLNRQVKRPDVEAVSGVF